MAVWLVRIDRQDTASVVDGYVRNHVKPPYPAHLQPTLEQLNTLLEKTHTDVDTPPCPCDATI